MLQSGDPVQIQGCSHKLRYLQTSTGNSDLDSLLGGALPNTAVCVVDELNTRCYGDVLLRYFASEGAHNGHDVLAAGPGSEDLFKRLPKRIEAESKDMKSAFPDEGLKIAWRYQTVDQKSTNVGAPKTRYDLANNLEKPEFSGSRLSHIAEMDYEAALAKIQQELAKEEYSKEIKGSKKRFLRVVLSNLGSPLWSNLELLPRFLADLRFACRHSYAVVMATIDSGAIQKDLLRTITALSDAMFQLAPIEENQRKALGLSDKTHGYFKIIRLPCLHTTLAFKPAATDLTFELHRRHFDIKVLHLPPAFEDYSTTKEPPKGGSCSAGLSAF
ncbi:unnamed protein product, partial [Mesorhabditis spiculigera]